MRLAYFCIGSIATQDLLISQCFLPNKALAGQAQHVWSAFLNVFQEQDWPTAHLDDTSSDAPSPQPTSTTSSASRRQSGVPSSALSSDTAPLSQARAPPHVAVPLWNQQDGSCYVYKVVADIVLVAVCPPPLETLNPQHPVGPTSLPHSYHALIEFLDYLTRAFDKYLNTRTTTNTNTFTSQQSTSHASTGSKQPHLSAALITANTSLVYEILDECLELGYPTMPSLQQLDLLIFGTAKSEHST